MYIYLFVQTTLTSQVHQLPPSATHLRNSSNLKQILPQTIKASFLHPNGYEAQ